MPSVSDSLINLIFRSTWYEILLISLFILPILLASWAYILTQFNVNNRSKFITGILIISLYIIALGIAYYGRTGTDKLQIAEQKVLDYFEARKHYIVGFKQAREEINNFNYSYNELIDLAEYSKPLVLIDVDNTTTIYQDTIGFKLVDYDYFKEQNQSEKEKLTFIETKIKNYLIFKRITKISFQDIRIKIDSTFTDDILRKTANESTNIVLYQTSLGKDYIVGLEFIKF